MLKSSLRYLLVFKMDFFSCNGSLATVPTQRCTHKVFVEVIQFYVIDISQIMFQKYGAVAERLRHRACDKKSSEFDPSFGHQC